MPKKYKLMERAESFDSLLNFANTKSLKPGYDGLTPLAYSQDTGFHIYAELRPPLDLSAAEDPKNAVEYLQTINKFAQIAEATAAPYSAKILEVQGEIIHFFMPCLCEKQTVAQVIVFAKELHDNVKESVSDDPFVMACDHGQTIFVLEGNGSSQSMVSLSPAANAPAKHLGRNPDQSVNIPSRNLRMRREHLELLGLNVDGCKAWDDVPLERIPKQAEALASRQFNFSDRRQQLLESANESIRAYKPTIMRFSANEAVGYDTGSADVNHPAVIQGFFMRADLDGFTSAIETAFKAGPSGIFQLVTRFSELLEFANEYIEDSRSFSTITKLPWAGDCSNLLVSPTQETYEAAQTYLPVKLGARWHDQAKANADWDKHFGDAKWAVVVAGGTDSKDGDTGNNGKTLIAKISLNHRDFLIAAGWSVGRSLDAFTAGQKKEDIVVHKTDLTCLNADLQKKFSPMTAYKIFYRARVTMDELRADAEKTHKEKNSGVYTSAGVSATLIKRPHAR